MRIGEIWPNTFSDGSIVSSLKREVFRHGTSRLTRSSRRLLNRRSAIASPLAIAEKLRRFSRERGVDRSVESAAHVLRSRSDRTAAPELLYSDRWIQPARTQ